MTNAEKIKSLSMDELTLFMYHICGDGYGSYFINRRYCELGACGKRDACHKLNSCHCLADLEAGVPYSEYIWWLKMEVDQDEWDQILAKLDILEVKE